MTMYKAKTSPDDYISSSDLNEFFELSQKRGSFATVCDEESAEFVIWKAEGFSLGVLYIRFCEYNNSCVERIRSQANAWRLSTTSVSEAKRLIHRTKNDSKDNGYLAIENRNILVQDGDFIGVVGHAIEYSGSCKLVYALTADYRGKPLLFRYENNFLSSDHDETSTSEYYLVKK